MWATASRRRPSVRACLPRRSGTTRPRGSHEPVLARLERPAGEDPCAERRCVCLDDGADPLTTTSPLVVAADAGSAPVACSLEPDALPARVDDWHGLLTHATHRRRIPGGMSCTFPVDAELAGRLVRLAAAERGCCRFLRFTVHVAADALDLHVTAPPDAEPVVTALFGGCATAGSIASTEVADVQPGARDPQR